MLIITQEGDSEGLINFNIDYTDFNNNEYDNLTIAEKICEIIDLKVPKSNGSYRDQIKFVEDRLGHDFRYAIDASKIKKELGWSALESFHTGLEKTVDWYLKKYQSK